MIRKKKYVVTVRFRNRLFGGCTYNIVINSSPLRLLFDLKKLSKGYEIFFVKPFKET